MRVLLVEDNLALAQGIETALVREGHAVDHAASASAAEQQGLAKLHQRLVAAEATSHTGEHHTYEAPLGFQIWRRQGELLGHSASLPARPLVPLQAGYHRAELSGEPWLPWLKPLLVIGPP